MTLEGSATLPLVSRTIVALGLIGTLIRIR